MTSNEVAMTETLEGFSRNSGHEGLGEIYGVPFIRDLAPEGALHQSGLDDSTMEEITDDYERSVESMASATSAPRTLAVVPRSSIRADGGSPLTRNHGARCTEEPGQDRGECRC